MVAVISAGHRPRKVLHLHKLTSAASSIDCELRAPPVCEGSLLISPEINDIVCEIRRTLTYIVCVLNSMLLPTGLHIHVTN